MQPRVGDTCQSRFPADAGHTSPSARHLERAELAATAWCPPSPASCGDEAPRVYVTTDGLTIFTYTAEPGTRSQDALKLLGSWAATVNTAEAVQ
jgi:hypothetical protein